ncbi:MAG: type II toxin-antitoxin system RelE/ParE family toxin [Deltaproteobacteria bacterium]|jgi:plasmid stabilization system protein ParE|nr:type II toxin-antitoxin system RelE/ParE family toxin [Deltaproteobacteria bacterium]
MSLKLIIRPEAEAEMMEAFDWYEAQRAGLGAELLLSIDAAINAISRNPQQYPIVYKNLHRALIRRFPYQIIYITDKEYITVIAVFHARRNPKRWCKAFQT